MVQLPGLMYPGCVSVVWVVVKWFVFFIRFGYKRKIVTSVSSEKVEAFSLHFESRAPMPYTYFFKPCCWVKRFALSFPISLPSSLAVIDYCNSFLNSSPASDFSFPYLVFLILSVRAQLSLPFLCWSVLFSGKIKVLRMASKASQGYQTHLFHIERDYSTFSELIF